MLKPNSGKEIQNKDFTESATNSPRPGDFPLGSTESRAAARAVVEATKQQATIIQEVIVHNDGSKTLGKRMVVPVIPGRK